MRCKTLCNAILQTLLVTGAAVPTPDLIAVHGEGKANPRQLVWTTLNWLLKTKRVTKAVRVNDLGQKVAWWEAVQ